MIKPDDNKKPGVPISTVIMGMVSALLLCITVYIGGANLANAEKLRAIKARQDRSEIRLSEINKKALPDLRAFDAGVAATIASFKADILEVKGDVKAILVKLREQGEK